MSHRSRSWTSSPTWPVARPALLPPNAALLRCHRPEGVPVESAFVGQINRYRSADGDLLRHSDDKPTIGLLFCKTKNRVVAESALSGMAKRIGVAEYQLVRALPELLDVNLPSIEEIEAELGRGEEERMSWRDGRVWEERDKAARMDAVFIADLEELGHDG